MKSNPGRRTRTPGAISALIGVAVRLGACADDRDVTTTPADTTDAPTSGASKDDPMPDTTSPNGSSATPPTTSEQPANTLELNPSKTSVDGPSATQGDPIGFDESLFPGQVDPGLDPFIEVAAVDLARRLDVGRSGIVTISATLVTWSDASMGCPLPGMEYAQALQDGALIELGVNAKVYRYHSGGERQPFLCNQPLATPPLTGAADS